MFSRLFTGTATKFAAARKTATTAASAAALAGSGGAVIFSLLVLSSSSNGGGGNRRVVAADAASASPPPSRHPGGGRRRTQNSTAQRTEEEEDEPTFVGQCLERQLFKPSLPYPAWDYNWDGNMTQETTHEAVSTPEGLLKSRERGKARHIILIRHGQYDETFQDDIRRVLTPLGRKQAELTGVRLALLARGGLGSMRMHGYHVDEEFAGPCYIKALHVSNMTRAKETAEIISRHLPSSVERTQPDPGLNEGLPAPIIPARPDVPNAVLEVDEEHDRIEYAFRRYFYRSVANDTSSDSSSSSDDGGDGSSSPQQQQQQHEFEVIVGHGNVIRYFLCRALQLPPEAWLRLSLFNCSMTYIVIQPNGYVSARLIGDTGHLSYDDTSFSGKHGYNW